MVKGVILITKVYSPQVCLAHFFLYNISRPGVHYVGRSLIRASYKSMFVTIQYFPVPEEFLNFSDCFILICAVSSSNTRLGSPKLASLISPAFYSFSYSCRNK